MLQFLYQATHVFLDVAPPAKLIRGRTSPRELELIALNRHSVEMLHVSHNIEIEVLGFDAQLQTVAKIGAFRNFYVPKLQ